MSDACVAQLVRAVDWQSKDPGSNSGTVESVSFATEKLLNSSKNINSSEYSACGKVFSLKK